jgi:hypothetical protein
MEPDQAQDQAGENTCLHPYPNMDPLQRLHYWFYIHQSKAPMTAINDNAVQEAPGQKQHVN